MLRTLVNKFKSHTLTEEENSMGPPVRKSARLNAPEEETEGEHERDSGTESDDEELQRLDHTGLFDSVVCLFASWLPNSLPLMFD